MMISIYQRARRVVFSVVLLGALGSYPNDTLGQDQPETHPSGPSYPHDSDPSGIVVSSVVTIVRAHEDYLTFEQAWRFENSRPYIFTPRPDGSDGLEIPLPVGAEGVHVFEPHNGATVGESSIGLLLPIGPPAAAQNRSYDLIFQFSLPNSSSRHRFAQELPFAVNNAVVVVPLETSFERYSTIDVELLVPLCEANTGADVVCFDSVDPEPGWDPVADQDRRIARFGHGGPGSRLVFETRGWPTRSNTERIAIAVGVVALFFVGAFVARGQRLKDGGVRVEASKRALASERYQLIATLREVRHQYEKGLLPKSEYDLQDLVLRRKLQNIYIALGIEPDSEK